MFGLQWRPSWFFSKWRPARGRSSWRSAKIETVYHSGHMSQIWCFWKNLNQKSLRSLTMLDPYLGPPDAIRLRDEVTVYTALDRSRSFDTNAKYILTSFLWHTGRLLDEIVYSSTNWHCSLNIVCTRLVTLCQLGPCCLIVEYKLSQSSNVTRGVA